MQDLSSGVGRPNNSLTINILFRSLNENFQNGCRVDRGCLSNVSVHKYRFFLSTVVTLFAATALKLIDENSDMSESNNEDRKKNKKNKETPSHFILFIFVYNLKKNVCPK